MLTVIETDEFSAWAAKVWSESEREAFVDWIAANPEAGDVIPGSGRVPEGALVSRRHGKAWWR